jgi:DnaJ-class molecular chaperone
MTPDDALSLFGLSGRIPTSDEVKAAYRTLMKRWHPDKFQSEQDIATATAKAQRINEANCLLEEWLESRPEHDEPQGRSDSFSQWSTSSNERAHYTYKKRAFTPGFPDETAFEFFVRSSNIISAGYNGNTRKMYLKFHDNSVYEYLDVPPELFQEFMQAVSHGKFAHRQIYPNRKYRRCEEPNRPYRPDLVHSRISGRYNSDPGLRITG